MDNRDSFVDGLRKLFPQEYKLCNQYHRHKNLFVDPVKVQEAMSIPIYKMIQRPGDMVVTWPGTFHWGYNAGLNASMAVNYCPRGDLAREIVSSALQCSPSCKMGSTIFLPVHQLFEKKAFKCMDKTCSSKGFITPQGLMEHIRVEHGMEVSMGDIEAVACPQCGKQVKKLGSCNLCGEVVDDRKKHWQDCKQCMFCLKKGTKKICSSRKTAFMHFDHE